MLLHSSLKKEERAKKKRAKHVNNEKKNVNTIAKELEQYREAHENTLHIDVLFLLLVFLLNILIMLYKVSSLSFSLICDLLLKKPIENCFNFISCDKKCSVCV